MISTDVLQLVHSIEYEIDTSIQSVIDSFRLHTSMRFFIT